MPFKNIEFVPAICPKCGANMEVPSDLKKVHCMYCGIQFLLSEKSPEINYNIVDGHGSINNYIKVGIKHISKGRIEKAMEKFEKARDINYEIAEKEINKNIDNILIDIFKFCDEEIIQIRKHQPFDISEFTEGEAITQVLFGSPIIAQQRKMESYIKSNTAQQSFQSLTDNLSIALSFIQEIIPENKTKYLSEYDRIIGEFFICKYNLFCNSKSANISKLESVKYFKKSVREDKHNSRSIRRLKQLGYNCSYCHGKGICVHCNGDGICPRCKGSKKCNKCNGDGTVLNIFKKIRSCKKCDGDGICYECNGDGLCKDCRGQGKCYYCYGTGVKLR